MSDGGDHTRGALEASDWIVAVGSFRDRTCFISLFSHFAPKVKAYLLRHGLAEPTAEELAQETLLTVWRKASQFDPDRASASAWIYTIARNLRVDSLRHDHRRGDGRLDEPAAEPFTPERNLETSETEARLRTAMGSLPFEQAQVLQLSYFDERTHHQIAHDLGLPLGTVKSRIRLATAHLRQSLEDLV